MAAPVSGIMNEEFAAYSLRKLYSQYGFNVFKMNKFEEYDLYIKNKDFLISDNIITFTDLNGRLMAMKPDVTLSIIKSLETDKKELNKVYYDENVYRVPKGSGSYREIRQVGLECIGNVDDFCIFEVLMLAAKSLTAISPDAIIDISHMGILSGIIEDAGLSYNASKKILKCISEKNTHEISDICTEENCSDELTELIRTLAFISGKPDTVLPQLKDLVGDKYANEYSMLEKICNAFHNAGLSELLRIDFSVVNDMNYYNGIVFRGFIKDIPTRVLSGGQYDKLMKKMGNSKKAIGFAVYIDLLSAMWDYGKEYDTDVALLYDDYDDFAKIDEVRMSLLKYFNSVTALNVIPEGYRYKKLIHVSDCEVQ